MLPTLLADVSQTFGTVEPPAGVAAFDRAAGGSDSIGLLLFVSNLIKVATVVAGIWVFINFILAGYQYVTSQGDTGAHTKVRDKLTMSFIGLLLILGAHGIAALIGLLIFGDPTYILNPTITGPEGF